MQEIPNNTDRMGNEHGQQDLYHAGETRSFGVAHSFRYAFDGLGYLVKSQRNIKIQLVIGAFALVLSALLCIDPIEWVAVMICIASTIGFELVNTAIESVVDISSPEWSKLAKHSKDCAAAAVLVSSIGSFIAGCIIFIPHIIGMLSS